MLEDDIEEDLDKQVPMSIRNYAGSVFEIDIEEITDICLELVEKNERIGGIEDDDALITKKTVRPVFRCKVAEHHAEYLRESMATIMLDAEQLAADPGCFELLDAYYEKQKFNLNDQNDKERLRRLMCARVAVAGTKSSDTTGANTFRKDPKRVIENRSKQKKIPQNAFEKSKAAKSSSVSESEESTPKKQKKKS